MFVAPAILEARDASHDARRSDKQLLQARQARAPPGAAPPVQSDDDGDIISMILSGIFGGIGGDEETSTSTRSTTRSTSTRTTTTTTTPTTRSTSTSTSTRTTAEVVTTPPPPVVSTPASQTTRPTTTITQTVDGNANNVANNTSKPNSGLPSVVIGVIVAAAVIFGLIFVALIARKVFQARRRRRRATWAENGISPFQDPLPVREKALPPPPPPEISQDYASYPAYPPAAVTFANQPAPYSPAAASSAGFPAPYPFSGTGNTVQPNVGGATTTAAMFQSSSAYTPADLAGPVVIQQTPPTPLAGSTMPVASAQLSVVKRTFIPSLPDELSIANGEQVRVLSLYDDGWALCEKVTTGEKGVVPQECLESTQPTTTNTPAQQLAGSEESARLNRNSSLRRGQEQTY